MVQQAQQPLEFTEDQVKNTIAQQLEINNSNSQPRKRSMSTHVCSRWYRPPEICILETNYD